MKGSPGCPISGPLSPVHHNHKQPKTRPGCLKPRFGVRPAGRLGENNNMTGTHTILHQKTVMTTGVQVNIPLPRLLCVHYVIDLSYTAHDVL